MRSVRRQTRRPSTDRALSSSSHPLLLLPTKYLRPFLAEIFGPKVQLEFALVGSVWSDWALRLEDRVSGTEVACRTLAENANPHFYLYVEPLNAPRFVFYFGSI